MKRVELEPMRLCRVPHCPNELDAAAPASGPQKDMCSDCRSGSGLAIRLYNDARARGRAGIAPTAPRRRPPARPRTAVGPTEKEIEVLRAIAAGMTDKEIAAVTWRSRETIRTHISHLLVKLEAKNRPHLIAIGYQRGLLP